MTIVSRIIFACIATAALVATTFAWHGPGHDRIARQAVRALPGELPAFFRAGADAIAGSSLDPDLFNRPVATQPLSAAEGPEHYFDIENVPDLDKLPPTRYEFLESVFARKLKVTDTGLLPYAITEWTQRLALAFAEHRAWPDDQPIQRKCLVYAGILAHYSGDLCQPLHTTIHHDGRIIKGQPRERGIHTKMDAALGKLDPADVDVRCAPFDDVMAAAVAEIKRSHALVNRVYELEGELPAYRDPLDQKSRMADLLRERLATSARFTASLYLTAWRDSAKIKFPDWHRRPPIAPDRMPASQPGKP